MLAAEHGGIRPWELEDFSPDEERAVHIRAQQIEAQREVT